MALIQSTLNQLRTASALSPTDQYYTTDLGQEGFWYEDGTGSPTDDNTGTVLFNTSGTNQIFRRVFDAGFVNAKWFGAKGDGIVDDTSSIQAALEFISKTNDPYADNEASFGGGTVFLPRGVYMVTYTLMIGQNCRLIGVNDRYHFEYLYGTVANPSGAGTLIRANFENANKWVISSATYKIQTPTIPPSPPVLDLLPYDIALSKAGGSSNSYDKYIYRMGINIENLTIDGGENNAFGGIRLSNAGNSTIRNVGVHNAKCGIMLNTCWGGSIENCFVNMIWYGVLIIDCNSLLIIDSYLRGVSGYAPINEEDLPDFIYQDQPYSDWDLNDDVKYGKTGIYCYYTSSLSIIATVVEETINGISCLNSTMSMTSIHLEVLSKYGIVVGIGEQTQLIAEQVYFWNITAAFYFGKYAIAKLNTIQVSYHPTLSTYASELYVNNNSFLRNINFTNTIYHKRKYLPDIVFTDEGNKGQNYGAVYVNPDDGDDDNYGFNENDAVRTFDAALVRTQNQSTINPVNRICIKAAPPVGGTVTPQTGAALKSLEIVSIENVDILVTSYGASSETGAQKGRIFFEGDQSGQQIAMIGQIELLGNVNLYFRNVDLVCNVALAMSSNPTNLSIFGLKNAYSKVTFENNDEIYPPTPSPIGNIFLDTPYFIFQANTNAAMANPVCSLLDSKFVNIVIVGGSGLSSNQLGMSVLGVDCVQINSVIPLSYFALPNHGWQDAAIMRNNF